MQPRDTRRYALRIILFGALLSLSAHTAAAQVILEIRHHGGYGPRDPDPYLSIRVYANGEIECHCGTGPKASRPKGRLGEKELDQLRERILASGFLQLKDGASLWQGWWYAWMSDSGVVVYTARVDKKTNSYRYVWELHYGKPDDPTPILQQLEEAARPLREKLCGPEPAPAKQP